jgi:predicted metal-dependent hydrolase
MAQKVVFIPEVGKVTLAKRRGAKNLRLSIRPDGSIRVSLPIWAPYASAIKFVNDRADWIRQNNRGHQPLILKDGQRIGKSYRLQFISEPTVNRTSARLGINSITITSNLDFIEATVQQKALKAAERALKKEAEMLLPARLSQLAAKHGFTYSGHQIKRLTSRWGSCSSQGKITLNYFLVQLPWELIDYVIIHELVHTRHLNHGPDFWKLMRQILPDVKQLRKDIKLYRPILQALDSHN